MVAAHVRPSIKAIAPSPRIRLAESKEALEAADAKEAEWKEPEIPACADGSGSIGLIGICLLFYFTFLGAILRLGQTSQLSV